MTPFNKPAMRAASQIHTQLAENPRHGRRLYLPEYSWSSIQQIQRRIDLARRQGWHRAAARLTEELAYPLNNCRRELDNACRMLQSNSAQCRVSSVSDIYRDILALNDEFENVEIDLKKHTLSATTDCIILEHIHFGRFEIRLEWDRLDETQPYRVVALDPNPSAKRDDVTHPHVQDEQLCEGEGRAAIQAALAEGRVYDFFLLVSQLLHTYGRGSAFVELDDWRGTPCDDCGSLVDDDSRYYCERCSDTLCSDCSITCRGCDNSFCSDCVGPCSGCGHDFCSSCLQTCSECGQKFCYACCKDGLCHACYEKQCDNQNQSNENEEDNNDSAQHEAIEPTEHCSQSNARETACVSA